MRNLKKVLSLALALVMLVGMMVVGAGAASFKDDASIKNQEAVDVVSGLEVLLGDETGNFNPQGNLTRAQAATVIAKLDLGASFGSLAATNASSFSDVAANYWGKPYIDYCAARGLILGVGGGRYDPEASVTGVQFALMVCRVLGYEDANENITGANWETAAAALARKAGLTNNVALSSQPMTRDDMAQVAFNALQADMVEYDGRAISVNGVTIPAGKAEAVPGTGTGTSKDYRVAETDDPTKQLCEEKFPGLRVAVRDEGCLGVPTTQWFLGKQAGAAYARKDVIAEGEPSGVLATYTTTVGDVTKGQLYSDGVTANVSINVNGTAAGPYTAAANRFSTAKAIDAYKGATVYVMDTDDDGTANEIDVVYGYMAQVSKVTEATSTRDRSVDLKVYYTAAGATVAGYVTDDFEKDQLVMVYPDGKTIGTTFTATEIARVEAIPDDNIVTGTISLVSTSGGSATALTVDGTKYTVAGANLMNMGLDGNTVAASTYAFDKDYTLFLSNGYVVGVTGEAATADIGDIVYVVAPEWDTKDAYGTTHYYVQVVNMDGTTDVLDAGSSDPNVTAGFYKVGENNGYKTFTGVMAVDATATGITTSDPFGAGALVASPVEMKETDNSIAASKLDTLTRRAYITSDTRLLFIGTATGADLKVTLETGAMKQTLPASSKVLFSKNAAGNLIIEAIILGVSKVDSNGEVVFVKASGKTGTNDVGDLWTIYKTDGTSDNVPVAKGSAPGDAGKFCTYTVNDKGVYAFTAVDAASEDNGDGVYTLGGAQFVNIFADGNRKLLSVEAGTYDLDDINAADAVIVDLRASGAEPAINSVDDMNDLKITGQIFARGDKVETIVITDAAVRSAGTCATYTSETVNTASTTTGTYDVAIDGKTYEIDKPATDDEANQAAAWVVKYNADTANTNWTAAIDSGATVKFTCKATTGVDHSSCSNCSDLSGKSGTNGTATAAGYYSATLGAAVTTAKTIAVTVSGKTYNVAKTNTTVGAQLMAWVVAYNADKGNTAYTASTTATSTSTSGTIVLTAKAVGVKVAGGDNYGTNVTVDASRFTNGTAADA